jgi:hypothetical protein
MALLDWWRMGQFDPNSVYNVAPGGTFTTMMGPNPPPPDPTPIPAPPGSGPIATIMGGEPKQPEILTDPDTSRTIAPPPVGTPKQPEILADPRDERTVPPPIVPDPPPISPRKQPEVTTKIVGPDGKPTSDDRLKPTAASTAVQAGNDWDRVMKLVKDPKFGSAIAALAKGGGAGKGPAPPGPYHMHMIGPSNPGFSPGNPGSAGQMLQGIKEQIDKNKGKMYGRQRKERQDDPMQFEQDTYDFRRLRGRAS